jgi:hypothetical protein
MLKHLVPAAQEMSAGPVIRMTMAKLRVMAQAYRRGAGARKVPQTAKSEPTA